MLYNNSIPLAQPIDELIKVTPEMMQVVKRPERYPSQISEPSGIKEARAAYEDEVYEKSLKVLESATMGSFELDVEQTDTDGVPLPPDIPADWVEKYGEREAKVRWRIAKSGLLSQRDAPIALRIAMNYVTATRKERAARDKAAAEGGLKSLSVTFVNVAAPEFPVQKLDEDDGG